MRRLILDVLQGAAAVAVVVLALGVVDLNDRLAGVGPGMTRAGYAKWVDDSCLPRRADERVVARLDSKGNLRCAVFDNASYGRAPRVVAAAVMEAP